jgi:hypothetical protein
LVTHTLFNPAGFNKDGLKKDGLDKLGKKKWKLTSNED